ncbi:MAG: efflux RND transporter periplasmic adaptor subunit [Flavobacteriaceae bacterium]|nr:efflux RND transporter periplasmic adaptor subunit [Flavobacteriaceae bacterium]
MSKTLKIIFGLITLLSLIVVLGYFSKKNSKGVIDYKTENPFKTSIATKTVATGSVNPEEEIQLKPQISGIVDEIFVEEGDVVKKGDLIAKIRVVPNAQNLAAAQSRVKSSRLSYNNAKTLYDRNKSLFEKGVISKQDFENSELSFNQAKETLSQSQSDYQIIKNGAVAGSGAAANTNIVAQIPGTILEIPIREGNQVIESNSFNDGTTIATVADMSKMIFEGQVDEAEVGKLKEGTELIVKLGALEEQEFPAKLIFVAPKGQEVNGAVQFTIKADVTVKKDTYVRAGYSANAEIELESKDSVLAIKESLLQFDRRTEKPYVEILDENDKFKKRNVELGISDGINVEILDGVNKEDKIKVWNKASDENNDEEDSK